MDISSDTYRTLAKPSKQVLYKDKKSKFFGYAFPINKEDEVKPIIESLRNKHSSANHVCYAWQLGVVDPSYRANDDGEPNNSAGMPIYGQIQSYEVTQVLIAVARVFGGTKLGVGGLISAYKATAQMALDAAVIVKKTLQQRFRLSFAYPEMDIVMRTIKQRQLNLVSQKMELDCEMIISVRLKDSEEVYGYFKGVQGVKIEEVD
ncbi:YigZ family protein [Pricia sp. S334]|uniref:YigZ family protein n=1 Tax=Pricia mediterranea TaxID=3076079 RepID=A0ABU3LAA3_9FLAO|nr:YigZ family protein [Pricia sp. S334]MDT7830644.1 YigZ family protein [Pricia sp. S334]